MTRLKMQDENRHEIFIKMISYKKCKMHKKRYIYKIHPYIYQRPESVIEDGIYAYCSKGAAQSSYSTHTMEIASYSALYTSMKFYGCNEQQHTQLFHTNHSHQTVTFSSQSAKMLMKRERKHINKSECIMYTISALL